MREVGRQRERHREREREKERRGWCPAMQKMCCETHRGGSDHRFPAVAAPGRSFCASSRSPMWCERDRPCPLRARPPPPSPPIRGELRLGVRAVRAQSFSPHAVQSCRPRTLPPAFRRRRRPPWQGTSRSSWLNLDNRSSAHPFLRWPCRPAPPRQRGTHHPSRPPPHPPSPTPPPPSVGRRGRPP